MKTQNMDVFPSGCSPQMLSVTSSAEYCEQYVAYACRMSRLLNSPGKAFKIIHR